MAVLQPYLGMYFIGESFSLLLQGQAAATSVVAGKLHWSGFAFAVSVPVPVPVGRVTKCRYVTCELVCLMLCW